MRWVFTFSKLSVFHVRRKRGGEKTGGSINFFLISIRYAQQLMIRTMHHLKVKSVSKSLLRIYPLGCTCSLEGLQQQMPVYKFFAFYITL